MVKLISNILRPGTLHIKTLIERTDFKLISGRVHGWFGFSEMSKWFLFRLIDFLSMDYSSTYILTLQLLLLPWVAIHHEFVTK